MKGKWIKIKQEKGPFRASYTVWENPLRKDKISVWGLTAGKINPKKRSVPSNIKVLWEVKGKKFNTRFQALKFAKKYMREN